MPRRKCMRTCELMFSLTRTHICVSVRVIVQESARASDVVRVIYVSGLHAKYDGPKL